MKAVSDKLNALLIEYMRGERTTWYIADLYVFWLSYGLAYNAGQFNNGVILTYTGHDVDLSVGGNIYTHWPIEHGDITEKRGTDVADMDLTINYNPYDKISTLGITWPQAMQSGAFDAAYLSLDRLYSPVPWQYNMPNISSDYVLKARFFGRVDVNEARLTSAQLTVKSPTELLNTSLPRNLIKPSCLNKFCDSMCGLAKSNFAYTITAQAGSSRTGIVSNISQADGFFAQGTMMGITGNNSGITRSIKSYYSNQAVPAEPFRLDVAVGDTFIFYRGCPKTIAACTAYGNISRFRGFPFLPYQNVLL